MSQHQTTSNGLYLADSQRVLNLSKMGRYIIYNTIYAS